MKQVVGEMEALDILVNASLDRFDGYVDSSTLRSCDIFLYIFE